MSSVLGSQAAAACGAAACGGADASAGASGGGVAGSAVTPRARFGFGGAGAAASVSFDRVVGRLAMCRHSPTSKILPIGPDEFGHGGQRHTNPVRAIVEVVPQLAQRLVERKRRQQRVTICSAAR